jgi:hypothetical protein
VAYAYKDMGEESNEDVEEQLVPTYGEAVAGYEMVNSIFLQIQSSSNVQSVAGNKNSISQIKRLKMNMILTRSYPMFSM